MDHPLAPICGTAGSSIVKHQIAAGFNGFLPVLIILEYSLVGMIAVDQNQIVELRPGFETNGIADVKLELCASSVFFWSAL